MKNPSVAFKIMNSGGLLLEPPKEAFLVLAGDQEFGRKIEALDLLISLLAVKNKKPTATTEPDPKKLHTIAAITAMVIVAEPNRGAVWLNHLKGKVVDQESSDLTVFSQGCLFGIVWGVSLADSVADTNFEAEFETSIVETLLHLIEIGRDTHFVDLQEVAFDDRIAQYLSCRDCGCGDLPNRAMAVSNLFEQLSRHDIYGSLGMSFRSRLASKGFVAMKTDAKVAALQFALGQIGKKIGA